MQCGLCPPISSRLLLRRTSDTTVTDHNITFSHALHSSSEQINNMYDIITFILQYLNHAMERFHIRRFFTSKSSMFAWWGLFTFHFTSTNNLRAVKVKLKVGSLSIFPTLTLSCGSVTIDLCLVLSWKYVKHQSSFTEAQYYIEIWRMERWRRPRCRANKIFHLILETPLRKRDIHNSF